MFFMRRRAAGFLRGALAGLVALALQAPLAAAHGATATASRDRAATNAGVLGYLAIPDLDRAVRQAEALGQSISPGKTQPGSFKMILGAMLGDPGTHFYCDYDLIGLMRSVAATSDTKALPSLPPSLPSDPMTVAATLSQGSLRFRTRFPLMPFIAMGQAAAAARAHAPAPAPAPKPKPKPKQ